MNTTPTEWGTCASPARYLKHDCDTGFFQKARGIIGFAIDGIERAEFKWTLTPEDTLRNLMDRFKVHDLLLKHKGTMPPLTEGSATPGQCTVHDRPEPCIYCFAHTVNNKDNVQPSGDAAICACGNDRGPCVDGVCAACRAESTTDAPTGKGLKIRDACRRRVPLSGSDAQALEGGLQQVERELAEALALLESMTDDSEAYGRNSGGHSAQGHADIERSRKLTDKWRKDTGQEPRRRTS